MEENNVVMTEATCEEALVPTETEEVDTVNKTDVAAGAGAIALVAGVAFAGYKGVKFLRKKYNEAHPQEAAARVALKEAKRNDRLRIKEESKAKKEAKKAAKEAKKASAPVNMPPAEASETPAQN